MGFVPDSQETKPSGGRFVPDEAKQTPVVETAKKPADNKVLESIGRVFAMSVGRGKVVTKDEAQGIATKGIENTEGAFEGATGGIPRYAIKKATGYELPVGSMYGRMIGSLAPTGLLSTATKTAKIPSLVANAVEGAVAMNLIEGVPADEFTDLKRRIMPTLSGAALGAGVPLAIKAGLNTASVVMNLPKSAIVESEKVMGRLMNATHIKDYAFGKNPPKAVMDALGKDLPSASVNELHSKVQMASPKYVQMAKDLVAQAEGESTVNLSEKINDTIDEAINKAVKGGKNNQALVTRLSNLKETLNFQQVNKGGKVVNTGVRRILDGMKPSDAVTLKQEIGDLGKWTGNASDDGIVNTTTRKLYGTVREAIEKAVPSVKAVNETLSGLLSADSLLNRAAVYERGAPMFKGPGKIVGTAGALYGLVTGNHAATIESIGVLGLSKIANSVESQTKLAYGLSKMGKAAQLDIFLRYPKLKELVDPIMQKFQHSPAVATAIANARSIGDRIKDSLPRVSVGAEKVYEGKFKQVVGNEA